MPPAPRPWRAVLAPRDDVASGDFRAAEFAADLHKVAHPTGAASRDADPVEFLRRTYVTEGLRDLLDQAGRRLAGDDNAPPVITLRAGFGSGKTHALLGLWHLAGGAGVRRVALSGQHLAPTGEARGARRVHTLWGELAWQLGGEQAYALVADADRAGTNPGGALRDLLARHAPAVILVDEWVAYARQLSDDTGGAGLAGGSFDTQFTFAQSLTEAAAATSGVLLAISVPAGTAEEVGGQRGLEARDRLQHVVRRIADEWRPASAEETRHIVRHRLFVTPDAGAIAAIDATARAFGDLYRAHPGEFPREARERAYEERIRQTYPVHPELLDRIEEDWAGLERFQHTRSLLRLLSTVVHALWSGEGGAEPLIMPGDVPLASPAVGSELARYLPDPWQAVIDADVDGPSSEPARLDAERTLLRGRSLTTRLARTVFLGAAPTIDAVPRGIETARVLLGAAVPGDVPGNAHAALAALGDRATYFHSAEGTHWYDVRANLTRRARDRAERIPREEVWAEIVRRLRGQARLRGDFAAVHVCPDDSAAIPDHDAARLVILHPRLTHARRSPETTAAVFARTATRSRGAGHRSFRNMVVYLAADRDRMTELDAAVRDLLAWSSLASSHDLGLTREQRDQAGERRRLADRTVGSRLLLTYQWALVPEQPDTARPCVIAESAVEGTVAGLADGISRRLRADARLHTVQAAAAIRLAIDRVPTVWASGHIRVGELWRLLASYPYLPRLRDPEVLRRGVRHQPESWQREGFALAEGFDGERYSGLVAGPGELAVEVTDDTLLVRPDVAERQLRGEAESPPADGAPARDLRPTRFSGSTTLHPDRRATGLATVADEVIAHLAVEGVRLTVRVEIDATSPTGFDADTVRTVSENASTLRFDVSEFESEC